MAKLLCFENLVLAVHSVFVVLATLEIVLLHHSHQLHFDLVKLSLDVLQLIRQRLPIIHRVLLFKDIQ